MPDERSSDLPGGSDDPTRANDPVDPTEVHEPVDATHVQGAAPAAGMGQPGRSSAPFSEEPLRREPGRGDDDRSTAAWLWALLAAVLIGIVLFALLRDGDDDAVGTVDDTSDTAAPPDTAVEETTAETAVDTTAAESTTGATEGTSASTSTAAPDDGAETGGSGTVTATDGTDLLTLVQGDAADADRLAPYAGTEVAADAVEVLEVVEGQGAWIGTDDQHRLFVRSTEDLPVQPGDQISFSGSLEANAADGSEEAIELTDDQGAEALAQQGHHIEVRELATS